MKRMIILFILTVLLSSCFTTNSDKCIDYKGNERCTRFVDGEEFIWKMKNKSVNETKK